MSRLERVKALCNRFTAIFSSQTTSPEDGWSLSSIWGSFMRLFIVIYIISIIIAPLPCFAFDANLLNGFLSGVNEGLDERREREDFNLCIQQYGQQACNQARMQIMQQQQQERLEQQERQIKALKARQQMQYEEQEQRINQMQNNLR